MAKFELQVTPYQRKDPVTGEVGSYLRKGTARQTSPRLKAFQSCIREEMSGRSFTGGNAAENSRAVRQAFSEAARQCSAQVPARVEA